MMATMSPVRMAREIQRSHDHVLTSAIAGACLNHSDGGTSPPTSTSPSAITRSPAMPQFRGFLKTGATGVAGAPAGPGGGVGANVPLRPYHRVTAEFKASAFQIAIDPRTRAATSSHIQFMQFLHLSCRGRSWHP